MLDLLIIVLLGLAGWGGYRMGFVARAASWVGMVLGLFVGSRLMPPAIEAVGESAGRTEVLLVAVGLLLGGAAVGQGLGLIVGSRAKVSITSESGRVADAAGGGVAGVLGLLTVVWLLVPAVADMSGWQARTVRQSRIVSALSDGLPVAPDATQTLRRLLGDGFPQVFEGIDRSPEAGPVPGASSLDQATVDRVSASIVKVVGEACNTTQTGTGWMVGPGVVVTNAHVIAGESATRLETQDGRSVGATLVAIDPQADLAVLRAPDLTGPGLEVIDSAVGQEGATFGHPGGRPLELSPFRIDSRTRAVGRDIYGYPGAVRDVLIVAADLEPGDSGSPLVDGDGRVVAVAFAIAPDRDGVAFAIPTAKVSEILARAGTTAIGAGPCVS